MIQSRSEDYLPSPHGQRVSLASSFLQFRPPSSGNRHLSVKLLISVLAVVFTSIPCIVWWYFISSAVKAGVNSVHTQGQLSLNTELNAFRLQLLAASRDVFTTLVTPTESAAEYSVSRLKASGALELATGTVVADFAVVADAFREMALVVNASRYIYASSFDVFWNKTYVSPLQSGMAVFSRQYSSYARLHGDLLTGKAVTKIYLARSLVNSDLNSSSVTYYYLDPDTASPLFSFYRKDLGQLLIASGAAAETIGVYYWNDHLIFSPQSGLPELVLYSIVPTQDGLSLFGVFYYTSVYDVTDMLREALNRHASDRMFICFHNPSGVLLGASHGKFFSHSEIDFRTINPVANPPPLSELQTYTAVNSTDRVIYASGVYLLAKYGSWGSIPTTIEELSVESEKYWLTVSPMASQMGLEVLLVLLINVNTKFGPIDARWDQAQQANNRSNFNSLVILIVVAIANFGLAVAISLLISRPLDRLVDGMRSLAVLDVVGSGNTNQRGGFPRSRSVFSEVRGCEDCFSALARGMTAFVRYVPREVVTIICQDPELVDPTFFPQREATVTTVGATVEPYRGVGVFPERRLLARRVVTIMQADIAGFSTICENLPPSLLESLMTEYLQAMCGIICARQGILDKYIGDCIMAIWNAPSRVRQQELLACKAVLEMQQELVRLWDVWEQADLPKLRFRAGIHTDHVLVGNIGCDYRISYTCLGQSVYIAGHLESINKTYGTVALVSESTMSRACSHITFRKVDSVTLPGSSSSSATIVLFEPLFEGFSSPEPSRSDILVPSAPATAGCPRYCIGESSDFGSPTTSLRRLRSATVSIIEKEELIVPSASKIQQHHQATPPSASSELESSPEFSPLELDQEQPQQQLAAEEVLYCWEKVPKVLLESACALYQQGLYRLQEGDYVEALNMFLQSSSRLPQFGVTSKILIERCRSALASNTSIAVKPSLTSPVAATTTMGTSSTSSGTSSTSSSSSAATASTTTTTTSTTVASTATTTTAAAAAVPSCSTACWVKHIPRVESCEESVVVREGTQGSMLQQ